MSTVKPKLIVIDGNHALWRFGYVNLRLTDSLGRQTGGIYGVLRTLLRLKKRYPEAVFVVSWDSGWRSWRHTIWEGYKVRPEPTVKINGQAVPRSMLDAQQLELFPEQERVDIEGQIERLNPVLDCLGVPHMSVTGVESDDLASLLSFRGMAGGMQPVIYSGDRDYYQLLRHGVLLIRDHNSKRDRLALDGPQAAIDVFGCLPAHVGLYRALSGDPSDGIPGAIKGWGPVTIRKVLAQAGVVSEWSRTTRSDCVEGVTAGVTVKRGSIPDRQWHLLKASLGAVNLNYQLMHLPQTVVDLPISYQNEVRAVVAAAYHGVSCSGTNLSLLMEQLAEMDMVEMQAERNTLVRLQTA